MFEIKIACTLKGVAKLEGATEEDVSRMVRNALGKAVRREIGAFFRGNCGMDVTVTRVDPEGP
jgi:hypothetical protein